MEDTLECWKLEFILSVVYFLNSNVIESGSLSSFCLIYPF